MTLEKSDVVDAIGTEPDTGSVVLSIIDSWDWSDSARHLAALQEKLNCYLEFIESGQIFDAYPDAKSRPIVIDIIGRFDFPISTDDFFKKVSAVASQLNVAVKRRVV